MYHFAHPAFFRHQAHSAYGNNNYQPSPAPTPSLEYLLQDAYSRGRESARQQADLQSVLATFLGQYPPAPQPQANLQSVLTALLGQSINVQAPARAPSAPLGQGGDFLQQLFGQHAERPYHRPAPPADIQTLLQFLASAGVPPVQGLPAADISTLLQAVLNQQQQQQRREPPRREADLSGFLSQLLANTAGDSPSLPHQSVDMNLLLQLISRYQQSHQTPQASSTGAELNAVLELFLRHVNAASGPQPTAPADSLCVCRSRPKQNARRGSDRSSLDLSDFQDLLQRLFEQAHNPSPSHRAKPSVQAAPAKAVPITLAPVPAHHSQQPTPQCARHYAKSGPAKGVPKVATTAPAAPLRSESGHEVVIDIEPFLQHLFGHAKSSPQHKQSDQPILSSSKSQEASLKEELEARLYSDESSEIQDTIKAVLASPQGTSTAQAPVASSSKSSTAQTTEKSIDMKGKSKSPAADSRVESSQSTFEESLAIIRSIDDAFKLLSDEFIFPPCLDFTSAPSTPVKEVSDAESTSSNISLPYTVTNQPVKYYEQALTALLLQLDNIESHGNEQVRVERKEVVGRVEKALEDFEGELVGRYNSWHRKTTKGSESQPVDPVLETFGSSEVTVKPYDLDDAGQSATTETESPSVPMLVVEASETESSDDVTQSVLVAREAVQEDISSTTSPETSLAEIELAAVQDEVVESKSQGRDDIDAAELIDTFLQPTPKSQPASKPDEEQDQENASDWSEVEA